MMTVSMSFCLSLSVFLNWAKTLFFLLVSLILGRRNKKEQIEKWRDGKRVNVKRARNVTMRRRGARYIGKTKNNKIKQV